MLRVLLADSEPEAIKVLSSYINNFTQECDIYPVTDASRLLRVAGDSSPALLIADAEFVDDFAELTKTLYERCPDVKVVFYASISQSDQLQRCMQYDMLDYMYKPVKQSEFLRCIQRALDYFKAQDERRLEDERLFEEYSSEMNAYGELFIRTLLHGGLNHDEIADGFRYFRTVLEPDYTVFSVELDRLEEGVSQQERCLLAFKIKQLTSESLVRHSFRVYADGLNAITVLLSGRLTLAQVVDECEKIKENIYSRLKTRVSVGVGSSCNNPASISVSYREARAALKYRPALGYNSVIPIQVAEPFNSVGYAYPIARENELIENAVMGVYEGFLSALKPVIAALDEKMPIAQIVMHILTSINRRSAERGIDIRFSEVFDITEIQGIFTPADAHEHLKSVVRKICGFISNEQSKSDVALVQRAKAYITEHYYEDVSAAKIAVMLGTTLEYFERMFTEYEGTDVGEFAAKLRMLEAKTLIRRTAMDDELIAIKIGYADVKQFRSEFKAREDMSVREYRKTHEL